MKGGEDFAHFLVCELRMTAYAVLDTLQNQVYVRVDLLAFQLTSHVQADRVAEFCPVVLKFCFVFGSDRTRQRHDCQKHSHWSFHFHAFRHREIIQGKTPDFQCNNTRFCSRAGPAAELAPQRCRVTAFIDSSADKWFKSALSPAINRTFNESLRPKSPRFLRRGVDSSRRRRTGRAHGGGCAGYH